MHTTHSNTQYKNESKHSEMGPVRQSKTITLHSHYRVMKKTHSTHTRRWHKTIILHSHQRVMKNNTLHSHYRVMENNHTTHSGNIQNIQIHHKMVTLRFWSDFTAKVFIFTLFMAEMITHQRSIVEWGGCFQRHLFVCQHNNFQTIEHKTMKLGG